MDSIQSKNSDLLEEELFQDIDHLRFVGIAQGLILDETLFTQFLSIHSKQDQFIRYPQTPGLPSGPRYQGTIYFGHYEEFSVLRSLMMRRRTQTKSCTIGECLTQTSAQRTLQIHKQVTFPTVKTFLGPESRITTMSSAPGPGILPRLAP